MSEHGYLLNFNVFAPFFIYYNERVIEHSIDSDNGAQIRDGIKSVNKRFIIRNSWGTGWGLKGYFTMPYQYLEEENLSDDFWTIRVVEV